MWDFIDAAYSLRNPVPRASTRRAVDGLLSSFAGHTLAHSFFLNYFLIAYIGL